MPDKLTKEAAAEEIFLRACNNDFEISSDDEAFRRDTIEIISRIPYLDNAKLIGKVISFIETDVRLIGRLKESEHRDLEKDILKLLKGE